VRLGAAAAAPSGEDAAVAEAAAGSAPELSKEEARAEELAYARRTAWHVRVSRSTMGEGQRSWPALGARPGTSGYERRGCAP